jgi:hypothetical protein
MASASSSLIRENVGVAAVPVGVLKESHRFLQQQVFGPMNVGSGGREAGLDT